MSTIYDIKLKATVVYEICVAGKSTSKTAKEYGIPVKTVEKWVTAYNKNPNVYNTSNLTDSERIKELEKEVRELRKKNEILKKTLLYLNQKE